MASEGIPSKEIEALCQSPHPFTKGFMCQQTMYRIKDPRKSLPFYTQVLGMTLLEQMHFPARKYSIFFLGHENPEDIPKDPKEKIVWMMSRKGVLELTQFDELGVKFVRRPEDFSAKGLAFIADPDGYWIELLDVKEMMNN